MKTAMQEFYDELIPLLLADDIQPLYWNFRKLYNKAMIKEKEQIKDAYHKGGYLLIKKPYGEFVEEVEQYYNQTYNKKEE